MLRSALEDYKDKHIDRGLATLLAIPPDKLDVAVRELARAEFRARRFDLVEVAAIALTESAATNIGGADGLWQRRRLLGLEVGLNLFASGDTSPVLRAWGLAADALGESLRDFVSLQPLLADLRGVFKHDAEILLASGSLYETMARETNAVGWRGPDLAPLRIQGRSNPAGFGPMLGQPLNAPDRTGCLKRARDFYREALAAAPSMPEARLRLARVLHQLGDLSGATAALDALPLVGLPDEMAYLAHLFRADVEEDLGHSDKARAAYLAAMEWRAQAPFVGLAALLRSSGDARGSLAVTERLFHDAPDVDPWWSYLKGQGWHLVERLDAASAAIR